MPAGAAPRLRAYEVERARGDGHRRSASDVPTGDGVRRAIRLRAKHSRIGPPRARPKAERGPSAAARNGAAQDDVMGLDPLEIVRWWVSGGEV